MRRLRFANLLISTVLLTSANQIVLGETRLGSALTLNSPTSVADLMAAPAEHVGKTVQVKGKVAETCERVGCWMNLKDVESSGQVRIKVNDGDIVFPKSAVGKIAIAEGKMTKLVLTREQAVAAARHLAEEQGRKFNPASVTSGKTVYQISGTAAVIFD